MRVWRVSIVFAAVAIGVVAYAQSPFDRIKTAPVGFDHGAHAKHVADCAKCHPLERGLIAKPISHATCFGSCHQTQAASLKMREVIPADRIAYCRPCHAETALVLPVDKRALANTKATTGLDHGLQLGHDSHATIACTKCHDMKAPRRGKPHDRCVACHSEKADKTFAITECTKCHTSSSGRPALVRSQLATGAAFSHAKHATRGAAKQCITCHAAIEATDARTLPAPKLETCTTAGCHDGRAAFNAITTCTKCHREAPKDKFDVSRPDTAFSHAKHATRTKLPCASCHPLDKTGEVRVTGHASCVDGCHDHVADFGKREPTICGACHDGTEPWRPLIADRLPAETTEFGGTLDHKTHPAACGTCHSLTTTRTELRPPRGHRSCNTSGCHAVAGGPAPQMGACETCHQVGLAATRLADRLGAKWSVRAMFRHGTHATKATAECIACHSNLDSPTVLSLAAPPKASCAAADCHDGGKAFKVTGTSCTRCHPGAKSP